MGARETALNALIACRMQAAWSNGILKEYIARDKLDARDAALAARLCYGVVQNRQKLDFYLQQLLTGRLKDLHPAVRDILHLGLYQIYELDKIPASAAVNESVALAKKYCKKQRSASGLVNAVLRKAVSAKGSLKEPVSWEDRYSHPESLIRLLKKDIGSARMEPMLKANNAIPETVAQVNTLKATAGELMQALEAEGVTARLHPWMENCLVLSGTGNLERLQAFRDGLFYIQDAASRLSVACADIGKEKPRRVLDCCAAPGGKSFAAAIAMGGAGEILSCDIHAHKTELIRSGAERLGLTGIRAMQRDAAEPNPAWEGCMDLVIADVPCSGYGIIRKKPDIRYKDPKEMEQLPVLQRQILTRQAGFVRPGGLLMYSTCTLLRRENEDVVNAFLRENPGFVTEPLPLPPVFPKNESGMLTLVPGEYDTDGFFICRLRRKA